MISQPLNILFSDSKGLYKWIYFINQYEKQYIISF